MFAGLGVSESRKPLDCDFALCEDWFVRVISPKRIREVISEHPDWETSLLSWHKIARDAHWRHFEDIKQAWSAVDKVGSCVVFDIAGNKARLISRIFYGPHVQRVYILHILSHAEYDRERWKRDCDCA